MPWKRKLKKLFHKLFLTLDSLWCVVNNDVVVICLLCKSNGLITEARYTSLCKQIAIVNCWKIKCVTINLWCVCVMAEWMLLSTQFPKETFERRKLAFVNTNTHAHWTIWKITFSFRSTPFSMSLVYTWHTTSLYDRTTLFFFCLIENVASLDSSVSHSIFVCLCVRVSHSLNKQVTFNQRKIHSISFHFSVLFSFLFPMCVYTN